MLRLSSLILSLLLVGACSGGTTDPEAEPDPPVDDGPGEWQLVWSDEFDGTRLDANRWSVQTGDGCDIGLCGWGNNEQQWYQEENLSVAGGFLTIEAQRHTSGPHNYTSARIRSLRKGDWTYARVEVRARMPQGQGLWPAVWMLPTDTVYGGWAASGEIDIVELLGHEPATVHGTLHYGGTWPNNRQSGAPFTLDAGSFADDFHVFALEWEEGVFRWYVDGELYQTQTWWTTTSAPFPAPFNERFHLLLNVAVGGDWPGNPDSSTTFPQSMVVDYVRVYQRR